MKKHRDINRMHIIMHVLQGKTICFLLPVSEGRQRRVFGVRRKMWTVRISSRYTPIFSISCTPIQKDGYCLVVCYIHCLWRTGRRTERFTHRLPCLVPLLVLIQSSSSTESCVRKAIIRGLMTSIQWMQMWRQ